MLWARFTIALRRHLAAAIGVPGSRFRDHARLSFAKVAEYQRRGLVHFHAVIRLDGAEGPIDRPPRGLDQGTLRDAIRTAARSTAITIDRPNGCPMTLGWGAQLDLRPVTATAARGLEDEHGEMTDTALAGYIAKYATKTTGATDGADHPIRDITHVEHLKISDHHRRMIIAAWELGERPEYDQLNLRRWAHMLGFRGHFLSKSQRYSTTFTALRADRRTWRLLADLAALDTDDPNDIPPDLSTVTVINDWWPVQFGHRNDGERELAAAIAERHQAQRRSTTRPRRAA
jgi:hypothetical protein